MAGARAGHDDAGVFAGAVGGYVRVGHVEAGTLGPGGIGHAGFNQLAAGGGGVGQCFAAWGFVDDFVDDANAFLEAFGIGAIVVGDGRHTRLLQLAHPKARTARAGGSATCFMRNSRVAIARKNLVIRTGNFLVPLLTRSWRAAGYQRHAFDLGMNVHSL